MPFQHRFLSVLAPLWKAKMAPKSTKNRYKSSFRGLSVSASFLHWFLIDFYSQLRPSGFQKSMFFTTENNVFSKNLFSKITSISASILVPTCVHVALENRRFSNFWRFQEAFKISFFFVSNFYRFWLRLGLQHGAILGAKTPQNPKNGFQKKVRVRPKRGS